MVGMLFSIPVANMNAGSVVKFASRKDYLVAPRLRQRPVRVELCRIAAIVRPKFHAAAVGKFSANLSARRRRPPSAWESNARCTHPALAAIHLLRPTRGMNVVVLQQPKRLIFGNGAARRATDEFTLAGRQRLFVVTGPHVAKATRPLIDGWRAAGFTVEVCDRVNREPEIALFEEVVAAAR